jgi:hypothetical protein
VLGHARELVETGQGGIDRRGGAKALGERGIDALGGCGEASWNSFPGTLDVTAPSRAPCESAKNWRKITPFPHFWRRKNPW